MIRCNNILRPVHDPLPKIWGSRPPTPQDLRLCKPRLGQKFEKNEISASYAPHALPLGLKHRVPEPVPSLETHHQQVKSRSNGCRHVGRKEGTRMKFNGRGKRGNGKTPEM